MTTINHYFKNTLLFLLLLVTNYSIAQTPCENGKAGPYPCEGVDLISNLTVTELLAEFTGGVWINDVWGWTDPDSDKEYALVGMTNGTSFVDVSDPANPIMLGILPEHHSASSGRVAGANSIWRDVKVFKNHAFVVSESSDHGMQVFDLTQLRDVQNPPVTFPETAHYDGIGKAHNIVINEDSGFAYAVGATQGSTCGGGGLHIININDPVNPVYAGCFDSDGYTHDAQCITYDGPDTDYTGSEVCFSSNEEILSISNVTDKSNPVSIATETYTGVSYIHQGWLSEDRRFFFSNDELDERDNGVKTKTFVWDIQDLDQPKLLKTYTHSGNAIDHNLYVKDTLIFESNYTTGLRILNLKNVETSNLEEVAFFDTYPTGNNIGFQGSWSNYPFFKSGNLMVTDVENGLFVLKYNPQPKEEPLVIASLGNELQKALKLFPNPAKDHFKINFSDLSYSSALVEVYDFSGKVIISSSFDLTSQKEVYFNSSELNKGLYHIRVSNGSEKITKKIVIK